MPRIRIVRLLGVFLLALPGAAELGAAPILQVTRGAVQDATRPQAVAAGEDEAARPAVRRQVYPTTVETVVDGRVVRIPARIELTTVAAERARCAPESDLVACRLEGRVDPDLFCWGSGTQRACPRGTGGSLTPQMRAQATGRGEPIEVMSWSWGRAYIDPDDEEVSLEYAWFVSGGGRAIDLISSLDPGAAMAARGDEGTPSESLSLNFTKIEPAGVGTPPDGEGSIRIPLHRVEPGLQLVRVALHRRDLPLCGVTNHFLFGGDCDDTDPVVRPGVRRNEGAFRSSAGGSGIPVRERR